MLFQKKMKKGFFFHEDFHFCLLSCIYVNDKILFFFFFLFSEGGIDVKM